MKTTRYDLRENLGRRKFSPSKNFQTDNYYVIYQIMDWLEEMELVKIKEIPNLPNQRVLKRIIQHSIQDFKFKK